MNGAGDPQTPGWPSVRDAHRLDHSDGLISALPKIPVQPIGYSDARRILKELGGQGKAADSSHKKIQVNFSSDIFSDPPRGWIGGLRRVSYKVCAEKNCDIPPEYKSPNT